MKFLKKPIFSTACIDLDTYRFAVNGDIWLCGCVVSEQPDDKSLLIGNIFSDSYESILGKKQEIIDTWKNKIPIVCKNCDIYTPRIG